jgi:hypothetical protein
MAEAPRTPDLAAQRAAMKKLSFLVGEWAGEATALRGPGGSIELVQTESAHFKLDGLVLEIEGVGRVKSDGSLVLQALGLISFDDAMRTYSMRAFNDGRWLETEIKLVDDRTISWGFSLGRIKTASILHLNERDEWTESAEVTLGDGAPRKMMDLIVRRVG